MKENILVIGYFGYETDQLDGQTIKTRNLYQLLKNKVGHIKDVSFFDTQRFKFHPSSVFRFLTTLFKKQKVVYLPAHKNLKYIFPLLYIFCWAFGSKLHYFVIGGWLPEYLANKKIHTFLLKNIQGIYVETNTMKSQLEEMGFLNVNIVWNFRIDLDANFKSYEVNSKDTNSTDKLKLVFLSRINKKKGIEFIFELAKTYLNRDLANRIQIEFYGEVAELDKAYFEEELLKYPSIIKYGGVVQSDKIKEVLKKQDVLLLPTQYYTEGLPGAVIDAYFAGIPVIVSNWKHAQEFVINEKSGLIFEFGNVNSFIEQIDRVLFDRGFLKLLKQGALLESQKYNSDTAWNNIKIHLEHR